jgi:hypothetical protein
MFGLVDSAVGAFSDQLIDENFVISNFLEGFFG